MTGRISPRTWALAAAAAGAAGLGLVWHLGGQPPPWYPPCLFHTTTRLQCPGCGSARALHALVQGDFAAALHDNALFLLFLPFLFFWAGRLGWTALRHNRVATPLPGRFGPIALVVVMVFFVARNLPWWPFTLLAPLPLS